jgi:hypothetical protein
MAADDRAAPTKMALWDARERVVSKAAWTALQVAEAAHAEAKAALDERIRSSPRWAWVFDSDAAAAGEPHKERKDKRRKGARPPEARESVEAGDVHAADVKLLQRADALRVAREAVDRDFRDQMAAGTGWVAHGCRGSPTASPSAIRVRAWLHLQVTDWRQSTLAEPDGTRWYDVTISPVPSEPATTPPTSSVEAPKVGPVVEAPGATAPRRSRKKGVYINPQQVRASRLLKQLYSDGLPSHEEVPNRALLRAFHIGYPHFKETEKPPSKRGEPSDNTILRAAGRK